MSQRKTFGPLIAVLLLVCGCSLTRTGGSPPTATPVPVASTPTLEPGWESMNLGVSLRVVRVGSPYTTVPFDLVVARIDPAQVTFRVHYTPREWFTIQQWVDNLDAPLLVVNANFFTEAGLAVGLVVTDGVASGASLEGYGGMFQVSGDAVRVRSLVQEPYQGEPYSQVAQGFPMLVEPGGQPASTGAGFDDTSRRTIIAQDTSGRVLVMVTPTGLITLRNAQRWLHDSDLNIDVAFGLDGGKSTGLYVAGVNRNVIHPSFDPVPVVIAAYNK